MYSHVVPCTTFDFRFAFCRLSEPSGVIHDGAGNYTVDTKCTWLIEAPNNLPIRLFFDHLATECGWDHLYVFDGPSVYSPLKASFR